MLSLFLFTWFLFLLSFSYLFSNKIKYKNEIKRDFLHSWNHKKTHLIDFYAKLQISFLYSSRYCFFSFQSFRKNEQIKTLNKIQVSILITTELGLFPLMCGCVLDICTLLLFNDTLASHYSFFQYAPFSAIFVHWFHFISILFWYIFFFFFF